MGRKPYKKREDIKRARSFRLSPECLRIIKQSTPMVAFIEKMVIELEKELKFNCELGINYKDE